MKKFPQILWVGLLLVWASSFAQSTDNVAQRAADAAQKFLATLDDGQRKKVGFDFKDDAQRKKWSNLPTTMVPRAGLRMGDLTQAQREAALALVAAALSPGGYETAMQIVQGDEELRQPGGRDENMFGRDNYYISILGQPSATTPWMIQFGGHHLGLNITMVGEKSTMAPSHVGSQPSIYQFEGKTVRPLGGEIDKASALLHALDESQRKKAILGFEMHDLVLGPGHDGETIEPEGIKGSDLTDAQREMLLSLASEWINIMTDGAAKAKLAEVRERLAETWFSWSGPTDKPGAAYFRIQGPTIFIEYAPQRLGGDVTKHIHTMYRDPSNEYGKKWLTE